MRTDNVRAGDIVEVDKKGRRFLAMVVEKEGQTWRVDPILPNITWRIVTSRELRRSWSARRGRSPKEGTT